MLLEVEAPVEQWRKRHHAVEPYGSPGGEMRHRAYTAAVAGGLTFGAAVRARQPTVPSRSSPHNAGCGRQDRPRLEPKGVPRQVMPPCAHERGWTREMR